MGLIMNKKKISIIKSENRKLKDLKLWEKNPRAIKEVNFEKLKNLISTLGLFKPFLITDDGIILGGNMRYWVCQDLGFEEVPVVVVGAKSEKKKLEFALADNDRAGYYVKSKVQELIEEHSDLDLDAFSIDLGQPKSLADLMKVDESEKPEVHFTEELFENHNYLVLYFDNEVDWLQLQTLYPLDQKKALDSKKGFEKKGVGRVVRGASFLKKVLNDN